MSSRTIRKRLLHDRGDRRGQGGEGRRAAPPADPGSKHKVQIEGNRWRIQTVVKQGVSSLHLKILLPFQIFAEKQDVTDRGPDTTGFLGLLPHRLDCTSPGSGDLTYETEAEGEVYIVVD